MHKLLRSKDWRNTKFRTLVSEAFYCKSQWEARLSSPIFEKLRMNEYFVELDRKFSNELRGSALDVDIYANNVKNETDAEHMEELLHKLRRTPHTVHTAPSTGHAAVRAMLDHGQVDHLLAMLDDRINYGLFLDNYTQVLALDTFLERGEDAAAARVASHLMLQEESEPLAISLGRLSVWRFWSGGMEGWEVEKEEEDDEVIRVRVKMVPNEYTDHHFDLREPDKIIGKTMFYLGKLGNRDVVNKSLMAMGLKLMGREEELSKFVKECGGKSLAASVVEGLGVVGEGIEGVELDMKVELENAAKANVEKCQGDLIGQQVDLYKKWNKSRDDELQKHYEGMKRSARLESIEQTKKDLQEKEEGLFFFDNFDKLEMEKEEKLRAWRRTFPRKTWGLGPTSYNSKKPRADDRTARWQRRELKRGPPK